MSATASAQSAVQEFWDTPEYTRWMGDVDAMDRELSGKMTRAKGEPTGKAERITRALFDINPGAGYSWQQMSQGPVIAAQQAYAYAMAAEDAEMMPRAEALLREAVRLNRKIDILAGRQQEEIGADELDTVIGRYRDRVEESVRFTDALYAAKTMVASDDRADEAEVKRRLREAVAEQEANISEEYRLKPGDMDVAVEKLIAGLEARRSFDRQGMIGRGEDKGLHSLWHESRQAAKRAADNRDRPRW